MQASNNVFTSTHSTGINCTVVGSEQTYYDGATEYDAVAEGRVLNELVRVNKGFTLLLHVRKLTILSNGVLASSAIGGCMRNVDVYGTITASALGHTANEGPGRGSRCDVPGVGPVGSGGGHGGYGGAAAVSGLNASGCDGGVTYGSADEASTAGSGGGGPYGGTGGGVVALIIAESLHMHDEGTLEADGGNAFSFVRSEEMGGDGSGGGSGGGAGGSVFVEAPEFLADSSWTGAMSAAGGQGSQLGGGGGGGYVEFRPPVVSAGWRTAPSARYATQLSVEGSGAFNASGDILQGGGGQDGVFGNVTCREGHHGVACQRAPPPPPPPQKGA